MFKLLDGHEGRSVDIQLNGKTVSVPADINVAAAILIHSPYCRETVVSGSRRGPFCMMGVCFDCLVEINGVANQQACLHQVASGMKIHFQQGAVAVPAEG